MLRQLSEHCLAYLFWRYFSRHPQFRAGRTLRRSAKKHLSEEAATGLRNRDGFDFPSLADRGTAVPANFKPCCCCVRLGASRHRLIAAQPWAVRLSGPLAPAASGKPRVERQGEANKTRRVQDKPTPLPPRRQPKRGERTHSPPPNTIITAAGPWPMRNAVSVAGEQQLP